MRAVAAAAAAAAPAAAVSVRRLRFWRRKGALHGLGLGFRVTDRVSPVSESQEESLPILHRTSPKHKPKTQTLNPEPYALKRVLIFCSVVQSYALEIPNRPF